MMTAWSSLTHFCLSSLLSITPCISPWLHPVSIQVFAGRPSLVHPCVGVHKRPAFMSLSLLLQQLLDLFF